MPVNQILSMLSGRAGYGQQGQGLFDSFNFNTQVGGSIMPTLMQLLNEGDPNKDFFRQTAQKRISGTTNRALRDVKQQMSGGIRGTGANLFTDIYKNESDAVAGLESNMMERDLAVKQNAIAQLLGLEGLKLQASQGDRSSQMGLLNSLMGGATGLRQNDLSQQRLDFERDQANPGFWDILGGLLGAGVGGFSGGLGGGAAAKWF